MAENTSLSMERLCSLSWNTFERYPQQEMDIILHCYVDDTPSTAEIHKFIIIRNFNATQFDPAKVIEKLPQKEGWKFMWLPLHKVDDEHVILSK